MFIVGVKVAEEVGRAVAEKRRAFEEWLQRRDRLTYDRSGHREWL